MKTRSLLLLAATTAALAGCADANPVSPRKPGQRFDVSSERTVFVNATTVWTNPGGSGSGGYVKGLATPVGSGTQYEMGDVEANGNDADYFVEQAGYTGQLDAFRYNGNCTFKWYIASHVVSTAGTIYLSSYPNASSILLQITCPDA
jgi:hypothetical protein